MTLPVWPNTLPQKILRDGYAPASPENLIASTAMEDGPEVRRRKRLAIWSGVAVRYRMTPAQVATFKAFWLADLNAGTRDFTLPMFGMDSASYVNRTVRIADGRYSLAPAGPADSYVSLSLKVRDL